MTRSARSWRGSGPVGYGDGSGVGVVGSTVAVIVVIGVGVVGTGLVIGSVVEVGVVTTGVSDGVWNGTGDEHDPNTNSKVTMMTA